MREPKASRRALQWAIDRIGSEDALADAIGTTKQHIIYWRDKAKRGVGAQYVLPIEKATGISRHSLRPDIYPRENVI